VTALVPHRAVAPALLGVRPIDDAARSGQYQMVFGHGQFAVVRWSHADGAWLFSSGHRLPFDPEGYRP
jgi:hypothetical protein